MPLAFVYIRIWYALQYIRFYIFQFAAVWLMIERNQLSKIGIQASSISAAQIEEWKDEFWNSTAMTRRFKSFWISWG